MDIGSGMDENVTFFSMTLPRPDEYERLLHSSPQTRTHGGALPEVRCAEDSHVGPVDDDDDGQNWISLAEWMAAWGRE